MIRRHRWLKGRLVDVLRGLSPQIKCINSFINIRFFMPVLLLFLQCLILSDQTLIKESWSESKLELILLNLVIEKLDQADLVAFFVLNIYACGFSF